MAESIGQMPTFKTYVEDDGYYILARPSNIGNVTYQLTPSATTFLLDLGYNHTDELPWGLVSPLKEAGHVYTNKQGVDDTVEGPSLDDELLPELSEEEARKLLKYLNNQSDVPPEFITRLRQYVGNLNRTDERTTPRDTTDEKSTASEKGASLSPLSHYKMEIDLKTCLDSCTQASVQHNTDGDTAELVVKLTMEYGIPDKAVFEETTTHTLTICDGHLTDWSVSPHTHQLSKLAALYRMKAAIVDAGMDSSLLSGPIIIAEDATVY